MPSLDPDLKATFTESLVKTARKLRTRFDARVVARGLTYPRARALHHLSTHAAMTQREQADAMELEGPTVARLIDGMEKLRLVRRESVKGDRRAKHVVLTLHGRTQAETVRDVSRELRDVILTETTAEDVTVALRVLATISLAIERDRDHAA